MNVDELGGISAATTASGFITMVLFVFNFLNEK